MSHCPNIVLGVTGSIAAYKACEIVSRLRQLGCEVHVVMTEAAEQFITPVTMQALSGAGYPGVPGLSILDNVIPYIAREEEKVSSEPLKILGDWDAQSRRLRPAKFSISASCNRVATLDGHLEVVSVSLEQKATLEEIIVAFQEFTALPQQLSCPTAPVPPIIVREEEDRPQPRLDRNAGGGMAVVVGRVRRCEVLDVKFTLLGHNTIRGAAGASVLNAELMVAQGRI